MSHAIKPNSESKPINGLTVERIGGKRDGEKFYLVTVTLDNGKEADVFKCNSRPGYFKQVFVPFEFEHPSII